MTTHYFYLDPSCGEEFEVIFRRAQSFAARALERLNDPTDLQFAEMFKLIFKTSMTDAQPMGRSPNFQPTPSQDRKEEIRPRSVLSHVRRELHSFAYSWERTRYRARAEVRIHWDGMGRYVQLWPKVFFDPVNYLVRPYGKEDMERLFREATATVMSEHPVELRLMPEDHHPQRIVIDFTETAREKQISWEACAAFNLTGMKIDIVADDLLEMTLIHEMMHSNAYKLLDFFGDNESTSGWRLLMGLTEEESYICAEPIAMLCLIAGLGDLDHADLPYGHRYTITSEGKIVTHQCVHRGGLDRRESRRLIKC